MGEREGERERLFHSQMWMHNNLVFLSLNILKYILKMLYFVRDRDRKGILKKVKWKKKKK